MESKKNIKADISRWRNTFFLFGVAFSLAVVLLAFEWTTSAGSVVGLDGGVDLVVEDDQIPITRQEQVKPPPPPPPPKISEVLTIVENDVKVEEDFQVEDVEAKEDMQVEQVVMAEEKVDDEVFFTVETMPEFPGGELALRKYIASKTVYPEIARENSIQGKVYVRFVVTVSGEVKDVTIARGIDPLLDSEALRVIKTLPRWKAGEQRGRKVNVWYTVPINFNLD